MPNCDFYAVDDDVIALADFIFANTDCVVYASADNPHLAPLCLKTTDELFAAYRSAASGSLLLGHMYSPAMRGAVRVERKDWEADDTEDAGWSYSVHGWGLIQLYLEGTRNGRILASHTNHNTEKRSLAWEDTYKDRLGVAADWDWKAITAISSKINRFIRKISPSKSGPLPIMPAAYKLVCENKMQLGPR